MKRIFILLLFISLSFLVPKNAFAQDTGWTIDNFHSDIILLPDGKVKIIETLNVNFNSLSKHGLYREIPYIYVDGSNQKIYTQLNDISVKRDGKETRFTLTNDQNYKQIKIGDANVTISGKQIYKIEYQVSGVIKAYGGFDEFYWNVVSDKWPVPVIKASATFTLPKEEAVQVACYLGSSGSKETCTSEKVDEFTTKFSSNRVLTVGEDMTLAVGFTKGIVPVLEVKAPKTALEKLFDPVSLIINSLVFVCVLLVGLFLVFRLWFSKGRDFWTRSRFPGDPSSKQEIMPIGAHETVVVEYGPPEKFKPAELGVLMSESAKPLDITATIIDLANRGYLTISEESKKGIFGSIDYTLTKKQSPDSKLLVYEGVLLDKLFKDSDTISLASFKNKFYKDMQVILEAISKEVEERKFFVDSPSTVRTKYLVLAFCLFAVSFSISFLPFGVLTLGTTSFFLASVTGPLGVVGLALLIVSYFMPRRTALGRTLYLRTKGYKLFINTAEKYRQQFFEKKNLFNEVLPYAIAFGIVGKFAKDFEKMGIQTEQPSWYTGNSAFNTAVFASSMASFSNSFTSTAASSPSSSGSGGGGSSGGGFGGGGGGSW